MSGPLLLGIAAVGVGWAWVHRECPKPPTPEPVESNADTDTVSAETPQSTGGLVAVADAAKLDSPATAIGDVPVSGASDGIVVGVKQTDIGGVIAIDPTKSEGGADPATGGNGLWSGIPNDERPVLTQGNTEHMLLATTLGEGGGNGMTQQQISEKYKAAAIWANEVF